MELEFLDAALSIRWSAVAATTELSAMPLFNVWKSFGSWENGCIMNARQMGLHLFLLSPMDYKP